MIDTYCASYRQAARRGHAGHRRHRRCRARPSATVAVQCALRRTLLPADPCLRHRHLAPGGGAAAAGQDAVGRGDPRPSAPPGAAHPPPLAAHADDHPRRQPLRPPRGDGRGARPTASTYIFGLPATPCCAAWSSRSPTMCGCAAPRQGGSGAPLHRDPLRRQILALRAARRRTHRGHHAGSRHPLRGHQPHARQRRVALRQSLLRARSGREPDQAAQEPACLRPHQLPLAARQSGAARAAHRRLLADADGARRHPQSRSRWHWPSSPPCALRLLKIAARITETATRVRIAFAAACPEAALFRSIARSLQPAGP